ncbi:MAG: hypothetical protein GX589_06120 [Deltaproteobacteria bacterium]|jgi:hypothetical protein|nr:hypothetical protein [Deltaproteobacteria bacterium]
MYELDRNAKFFGLSERTLDLTRELSRLLREDPKSASKSICVKVEAAGDGIANIRCVWEERSTISATPKIATLVAHDNGREVVFHVPKINGAEEQVFQAHKLGDLVSLLIQQQLEM